MTAAAGEIPARPGQAVASVSPSFFVALGAALGFVLLGEAAAIWLRSSSMALLVVLWYAVVFTVASWRDRDLAWLAFVTVVPLVTVEVAFGEGGKTVSTDKVALLAAVVVWLLRDGLAHVRRLLRVPAVRWWLGFLVAVLCSALRNGATASEIWGVGKQAIYAGLFVAALETLDGRLARCVLLALGLTAGAVGLLALVQYGWWRSGHWLPLGFHPFVIEDIAWRGAPGAFGLGSTIGQLNFLGAYLALGIAVLVGLMPSLPGGQRPWGFGALALAVTGLVAAKSVGAVVGVAAAAATAMRLLPAVTGPRSGRSRRIVDAVTITLVAVMVILVIGKAVFGHTSFSVRVIAHRIGVAAIAERPLLGFGEGGFSRESVVTERRFYGTALRRIHDPREGLAAHSSYLQVAVERGLLGLAAFAGLLGSLFRSGLRRVREAQSPSERWLAIGLLAALVAFLVQAFTENLFDYSKVAAMFWIVAAVLIRPTAVVSSSPRP